MRTRLPIFLALGFLTGAVVPAPSEAHVVRFVVEETRPFAGGMSFGTTGPYERLDGTVYMEVDPNDPLHAVLVNLDKAPETLGVWWSSAHRSLS